MFITYQKKKVTNQWVVAMYVAGNLKTEKKKNIPLGITPRISRTLYPINLK